MDLRQIANGVSLPESSARLTSCSHIAREPIHCRNALKQRYADISLAPVTYYESVLVALFAQSASVGGNATSMIERYGVLRFITEQPGHLEGAEMGSEQQTLYALRRMYREIAFTRPKTG